MKRWLIGLCLTFVLLFAIGQFLPNEPACEALKRWAVGEVEAQGHPSLADISKYRVVYRKALFNELPVAARRELWTAQLNDIRATESLTLAQHEVLVEAEQIIAQAYDPAHPLDPNVAKLFAASLKSMFPDAKQRRRLFLLGPDDRQPVRNPLLLLVRENTPFMNPDCECRSDGSWGSEDTWDDCPSYAVSCSEGYNGCSSTWFGCGGLWAWSCNGGCYYGTIYGAPNEQ